MAQDAQTGRSLDQALSAGPLNPAAGAALADDLYAALDALHRSGQTHGYVRESLVRLQPDGSARLQPAGAPGGERATDVRAAAELVCTALGIPLHWMPAEPLRESERAAPALAATLRALAQGSLPLDAAGAQIALREAAGGLVEDDAVAGARAELAARAGATPPPAAAAPHHHAPPLMMPLASGSRRRPVLIGAGIAALVVLLGALGALGWITAGRHSNPSGASAPRTASPAPARSASPQPLPSIPTSSGPVKSVVETPQSTCEAGSACKLEVDVHFVKLETPQDIAWQFELVDSCTSETTYVDGGVVHAQKGWVHAIGDSQVTLPAGHPLAIVAITTAPSHAASAPLLVTGGTC